MTKQIKIEGFSFDSWHSNPIVLRLANLATVKSFLITHNTNPTKFSSLLFERAAQRFKEEINCEEIKSEKHFSSLKEANGKERRSILPKRLSRVADHEMLVRSFVRLT